jgi:phenylacetate-coenzyme A ligase PaaK-like adenylate-forming protein
MRHFDDWVTDPSIRLEELRRFLADPARIGEPWRGHHTVWESSGTRGEPGVFAQDAQAMAVYDTLEALRRDSPRPWQRLLDPLMLGERMAFVGAISGHFASQVSVQRLRRSNPWMQQALRSFSILQPVEDLVAQLNHFAPTILATYPTAAAMLAEEARRGTLRIRPVEVWTGGETLSASVRRWVTEHFGCALRNSYGASEFLSIAWECARGQLHVNSDWVILEAVDAQHRPVPDGSVSHTTLLTNLANHVQPLIRCDIGDRIRWHDAACACGSPLPVIEVQGREDAPLQMAGRNGRPVTLLPLALTTVLEDEAGVFDFQLGRRDAHTLVLRLGSGVSAADAGAKRCADALRAFGVRQGVVGLKVIVQPGHPLKHGRSGKLQRVLAEAPGLG